MTAILPGRQGALLDNRANRIAEVTGEESKTGSPYYVLTHLQVSSLSLIHRVPAVSPGGGTNLFCRYWVPEAAFDISSS